MTTIVYPEGLRGPLAGKTKQQSATFRVAQPLSGPSYIEQTSTDAPVLYTLNFTFNSYESQVFRAWVEVNNIYRGVEFQLPLRNEFFDADDSQQYQIGSLVEGDIRSCTNNGRGVYRYSGVFRIRTEVTNVDDYYQLIIDGGVSLLDGREQLDEAMNLFAPVP